MKKVLRWASLARSMGARYVLFRIFFELKKKTGILKNAFPVSPPFKKWISLEDWRKNAASFFFSSREEIGYVCPSTELLEKAERIRKGELQFFHGEWMKVELHDWTINPSTGYQYDVHQHWTQIPDFHPEYGDIKYVWEKSRFTFLQTILRGDAITGEDSSEWVFNQIDSWINQNPINCGPNYRCSQEISLRVFNWTLALYFYRNSSALTEVRFEKILFHVYWQMKHVRSNIHFSRIAVRNNHAITETLALYTAGLLFNFFPESQEWKRLGKKWFEQEIAYQIYPDGGFLQFSFNYHRVVIQLLTWAISIAKKNGEVFSPTIYQRAYASVSLMKHSQAESGWLPNYGSNDGALFFHWNDSHFRDHRPSLDALHFMLTGLWLPPANFEDKIWFGLNEPVKDMKPVHVCPGVYSFPHAGIYVYRTTELLVWLNCTPYRDRPLQADMLHMDVWFKGKNLLIDAGSYRYNTAADLARYFSGTESHNTVMLGDYDQMLKGIRFIWMEWSQFMHAGWTENETEIIFNGVGKVFRYLGDITHERTIKISKTKQILLVTDTIHGNTDLPIRQLWHVPHEEAHRITFTNLDEAETEQLHKAQYASPTYGVLEKTSQIEFRTLSKSISTQIILK